MRKFRYSATSCNRCKWEQICPMRRNNPNCKFFDGLEFKDTYENKQQILYKQEGDLGTIEIGDYLSCYDYI